MKRSPHCFLALTLAVILAGGCVGKSPAITHPARSSGPATGVKPGTRDVVQVAQSGDAVHISGVVKILSDRGDGVLGNNGAAIISNNGGGILSDHGAGVVSNNGGGLTGKTKYHVAEAGFREWLLADAVIHFYDAGGRQIQDETGAPLTATTNSEGNYTLAAVLPPGNLVMRVELFNGGKLKGGTLTAMLVRERNREIQAPIDTSTSLGAAYVLGKYVSGDQLTFDRLPAREAERLRHVIDQARSQLNAVPLYDDRSLIGATETLRVQVPGLDSTLKDIQALLLGQANLGNGLAATEVALAHPTALLADGAGGLLIGEPMFGRIRKVGPDGKLGTFADILRGTLKQNFPRLTSMVRASDGAIYLAQEHTIYRIEPEGKSVKTYAGNGLELASPVAGLATEVSITPGRLALGVDGKLYVAERDALNTPTPRVLVISPDGRIEQISVPGIPDEPGAYMGLAAGRDGTLYLMKNSRSLGTCSVYKLPPGGGTAVELLSNVPLVGEGGGNLVLGEDATLYVAIGPQKVVYAISPDGLKRTIAGRGAPPGYTDLESPDALALDQDGTLLIGDAATNLVHAWTPDGRWYVRAGNTRQQEMQGNLRSISLNAPEAAAFDDAGTLFITDLGSYAVRAYDGKDLRIIAGGEQGEAGDGGLAIAGRFMQPTGIAYHEGDLVILDSAARRLRAISKDGMLRTVFGPTFPIPHPLAPGARYGREQATVEGNGIAIDRAGRIYWATTQAQVLRLALDGRIEVVAGKGHSSTAAQNSQSDISAILEPTMGDGGPAVDAAFGFVIGLAFDANDNLYVADMLAGRVRKISGLDGPNPTITSVAGIPFTTVLGGGDSTGAAQDGALATETAFYAPAGLCFDRSGNLYVSEIGTVALPLMTAINADILKSLGAGLPPVTARIRRITPDGRVKTIAGPGTRYFPDPAREDGLVIPGGLAIAPDGRLAIVDAGANLVRIIPAGEY